MDDSIRIERLKLVIHRIGEEAKAAGPHDAERRFDEIIRMSIEALESDQSAAVKHEFDKDRRCVKCGIQQRDALGRPNVCVPRCLKHVPEGYEPCTRAPGHDGPCAHPRYVGGPLSSTCDHVWGIDGQHSNEYCKKCFIAKPKG